MTGAGSVGVAVLVAGSAAVGAVHALLPDHWVPFVVLSKARGWDIQRSLAAVAAGGVAHLASTAALGLLLAFAGTEALTRVGPAAELGGAALLTVFGLVLSLRGLRVARGEGRSHGHDHGPARGHDADDHREESHSHDLPARPPGWRGLLLQGAVLGARPCAEAVPVFLAAAAYGLTSSLLAVAAWVAATLGTMLAVVWLSLHGLRAMKPELLARHGELAAGLIILFMGLGAVILGLR